MWAFSPQTVDKTCDSEACGCSELTTPVHADSSLSLLPLSRSCCFYSYPLGIAILSLSLAPLPVLCPGTAPAAHNSYPSCIHSHCFPVVFYEMIKFLINYFIYSAQWSLACVMAACEWLRLKHKVLFGFRRWYRIKVRMMKITLRVDIENSS